MNLFFGGRKFIIIRSSEESLRVVQDDDGDFDEALHLIDQILGNFRMSHSGSIWGCDGVGYAIERKNGRAFRLKSGVGSRKFKEGLLRLGI